jgi:hypothetical protein
MTTHMESDTGLRTSSLAIGYLHRNGYRHSWADIRPWPQPQPQSP